MRKSLAALSLLAFLPMSSAEDPNSAVQRNFSPSSNVKQTRPRNLPEKSNAQSKEEQPNFNTGAPKLRDPFKKPNYDARPPEQPIAPIFYDRLTYNLGNPISAYTGSASLQNVANIQEAISRDTRQSLTRSLDQTFRWMALKPIEQRFLQWEFISRFDEKVKDALSPEVEAGQLVNPLDEKGEGRRRLNQFSGGTKANWGFEPFSNRPYFFGKLNDTDIGVLDIRVRALDIMKPSTWNDLPTTTAIFHKSITENWSIGAGYELNGTSSGVVVLDRKMKDSYLDFRISPNEEQVSFSTSLNYSF